MPLIFLILVNCAKEHEDAPLENQKAEILNALNESDGDHALSLAKKASQENPKDLEFLYFQAQAYAIKAQVDIYSLFPIMKMKLFDVAINEWNSVQTYEKRQRQQTTTTLIGDEEVPERLEELNQELNMVMQLKPADMEWEIIFKYEHLYEDQWNEEKDYCSVNYEIQSDIFISDSNIRRWFSQEIPKGEDCKTYILDMLDRQEERIQEEVHKHAISIIKKQIKRIKDRKTSEKYIKAGFALYESVPIIKNVPAFEGKNTEYINKALEILERIRLKERETTRLGRNVRQHMGLLSGFLILGGLKSSIDFDAVEEPHDLACHTYAEKLVEQYEHFLTGGRYLINATIGTEFSKKNEKNFNKLQEILEDTPNDLTEEQKESIIDDIQDYQEDNC